MSGVAYPYCGRPAVRYTCIVTPLAVAHDSTSSSARSGPASGNSRLPWPTTTGAVSRVSSSTRSLSSSNWTTLRLPTTCSSPPGLAFSSPTAAATSPERTAVSAHFGSVSVVDATHFGPRVQHRCDGVVGICHRSPGAGEDLVGPPAEQERVGALVDLACQGRGLAIEVRHGPSAALEPAAAVLLRPAEPLHHAVDRDVHVGRQLHGRGSLLVGLVASDRSAIAHLLFREHFRLSMVARPPTFSPSCSPDKRFENGPSRQFLGDGVPTIVATVLCVAAAVARMATKNFSEHRKAEVQLLRIHLPRTPVQKAVGSPGGLLLAVDLDEQHPRVGQSRQNRADRARHQPVEPSHPHPKHGDARDHQRQRRDLAQHHP